MICLDIIIDMIGSLWWTK